MRTESREKNATNECTNSAFAGTPQPILQADNQSYVKLRSEGAERSRSDPRSQVQPRGQQPARKTHWLISGVM